MQQVFFDPRQFVAGQQVQRDTMARNALADLAPAAIQGNQNALARLARTSPEMAMEIHAWRGQQEDRADARRVRQETLDLNRRRLTNEERKRAEALAAAQTAEQQEATRSALKNMLLGARANDPQQYAAGMAALRRVDPTVENLPMESFDEFGALLEGMSEVWAQLPTPELSAAEQEIARLMETGLSRTEAIEVMDGVRVTSTNPQTGEAQVLSKGTGLPVSQAPALPPAPTTQSTIPELSFGNPTTQAQPVPSQFGEQFTNSNTAFGLGGFARAAANTASDAVGLGQPFPGTAGTQRDFRVLGESLTNLIAQSYPRQPAQRLLLQIQDLLPAPGVPWAGPGGARDKLAALGRSLQSERASVERQLGTRKMRPNVRQQLEGQLAVLDQALSMVSGAHGSFGEPAGGLSLSPDVVERMRAYE